MIHIIRENLTSMHPSLKLFPQCRLHTSHPKYRSHYLWNREPFSGIIERLLLWLQKVTLTNFKLGCKKLKIFLHSAFEAIKS